MKKNNIILFFALFFTISIPVFSQIGINTSDPDASSALDITSTSQGVLIPRMTTAQRQAIQDPAESLLVYDLDLNKYYFNKGTPQSPNWVSFTSNSNTRDNYVLVKDVTDFPGGGTGGTITLDENTLYEVNGTISLSQSIDLNNAYLIGLDSEEDVLNYTGSGALFTGSSGGNIRHLYFTNQGSGSLFNISSSDEHSLLFQFSVVQGFASVGNLSGLGLVFNNVVQFINNDDGITYSNIGHLLLSNQAWFLNNSGTYEKFIGTFAFVEKVSGFSRVGAGATAIDVSNNPTVGVGTIESGVFSGDGTYVEPYNSGQIYPHYNFTNDWTVDSPGIPREDDAESSGYYYMSNNSTATQINNTNNPVKIQGTTTTTNLFRTGTGGESNRLVYQGTESRHFEVVVTGTVNPNENNVIHTYYIYKNGQQVSSVSAQRKFSSNDVGNFTLVGLVNLDAGDYIEVWLQADDAGSPVVERMNVVLK